MSSTRVGVYIEGLGMKFVIFCKFFQIFWTPNGQKRLVATASTRGPIRSRHIALARALAPPVPRLPLARLSPGRALQRRRERGDTARSRRARAPSPGAGLSPASRPRAGGSGLFSPALPPALPLALSEPTITIGSVNVSDNSVPVYMVALHMHEVYNPFLHRPSIIYPMYSDTHV
jgi:hypothetical protein